MNERPLNKPTAALFMTVLAGLASATAFAQSAGSLPPEVVRYADVVYVNAHIVTLDNHQINPDPGTIVQAMAVRDEVIIGLGSDRDMLRMAGPGTKVVDLLGKTVLPGIVESHVHPMGSSERFAREKYKLRNTPEGYVLRMDIAATPDDTMLKVAQAMDLLLSRVTPTPDEWLNIEILHAPELGFATPASVSTLMSAPRLSDVQITKSDISEIVPNYPMVLSSATGIMDAPRPNVWFHITVGPDGQPITEEVVALEGRIGR
ncbi:MAG: hypothetical protein OEN22_07610 [Gammaproteobacteria bacterium]|nr:hypothetical protein [Gammaproteobacteria bacterium]